MTPAPDGQCQMAGCTRDATHTMSFKRHEDIDVCTRHYRRNSYLRYAVLVALPLALALVGVAIYWIVL